jgi:hypothetical protein
MGLQESGQARCKTSPPTECKFAVDYAVYFAGDIRAPASSAIAKSRMEHKRRKPEKATLSTNTEVVIFGALWGHLGIRGGESWLSNPSGVETGCEAGFPPKPLPALQNHKASALGRR